uniref:Endonuclease/exonuclease/phosphatase domain-containing protein n=1 Tax=Megaselia scalaris TaxID=36166 RepID=T1GHM6_MEGSC
MGDSDNWNNQNNSFNDTYSIYRKWEYTSLAKYLQSSNPAGQNFTFISYNILAQDLLEEHMHIYKNHDSRYLSWDIRLRNIKNEVLTLRPDILCLQEVQNDHLTSIVDSVRNLNLSYVYKKKNSGISTTKWFRSFRSRNVALIAKFKLIGKPSVTFLVVTTHLLYNPRREDVRLAQIQLLLAEMDRYSLDEEGKRIPIILSGDFNSVPESATLNFLKSGHLNYENLSRNTLGSGDNQGAVGKVFLPSSIGITDSCQHFDLVSSNYKANRTRIYNSEYANSSWNSEEDLQAKFPE